MNLKCGIIGLPNVGKSTLFNILTKENKKVANFPFCTIDPNISIVQVHDPRIDQLAKLIKPKQIITTTIELVDIAGLVKGAAKGEGLGNKFLTNIRETEVIIHVVRCFKNDIIVHVTGKINPIEDINIINTELILSDLELCERKIFNIKKRSKIKDKNIDLQLATLEKCLSHLFNVNRIHTLCLCKEEKKIINDIKFLTIKPTIYIANVSKDGFDNNLYLDQVRSIAAAENSIVIVICGKQESVTSQKEINNEFITKFNMQKVSLNRLIYAGYSMLNLHTFFTVGEKELRAWAIPIGATALQAAGKIHSDFKKGFIRAKIISFSDFITYQGEKGAKEAGKVYFLGKDYVVKDGDIIHFLFKKN